MKNSGMEKRLKTPMGLTLGLCICAIAWQSRSEMALAHGVNIQYRTTEAIAIDAAYDSGEPMSNAQVTVYAPNDPATPWLQGTTDDKGRFIFAPDTAGNWAVRVRQAGHGNLINVSIADGNTASEPAISDDRAAGVNVYRTSSNNGGLNPWQTGLAIASGIWGFVGTALFFSRSSASSHRAPRHEDEPIA